VTRKISLFFIGWTLTLGAFGREEYTRTFDKTLPLRMGQKVYLEHKLGDITIRTHSRPEVTIHALIKVSASDENEAKTFAERVEILVEPGASELAIRTRYPERSDGFRRFRNASYFVRYELTIPETAPLEVRNSFGAVSVAGLKANSEITTSHGAVEFRDGRGAQRIENSFASVTVANNAGDVAIETSNGAVQADGIKGALTVRDRFAGVTVGRVSHGVTITSSNGGVQVMDSGGTGTIRNSFGNVTVHGFKGDLTVDNANGKVEALNIEGIAQLNTTFGEVQFADVARQLSIRANNSKISGQKVGGAITVENSFGPVTVSDVQGSASIRSGNGAVSLTNIRGEANVRTSFGSVQANDIGGILVVENNNGGVHASNLKGARVTTSFAPVMLDGVSGPLQITNQNGAVEAASTLKGSCQPILIRTSFSALRLRLQDDANYRVVARTSFGKVRTDFPLKVSGSITNDNLSGTIGGGRCEMTLTNTNGSIEILKSGS
jgi:hypothetical protein